MKKLHAKTFDRYLMQLVAYCTKRNIGLKLRHEWAYIPSEDAIWTKPETINTIYISSLLHEIGHTISTKTPIDGLLRKSAETLSLSECNVLILHDEAMAWQKGFELAKKLKMNSKILHEVMSAEFIKHWHTYIEAAARSIIPKKLPMSWFGTVNEKAIRDERRDALFNRRLDAGVYHRYLKTVSSGHA